jgi:hypothetical protein
LVDGGARWSGAGTLSGDRREYRLPCSASQGGKRAGTGTLTANGADSVVRVRR